MKKATAIAPSNIAFIKYWGRKDEVLRLPENGSLSMNLDGLTTTTTVAFSPDFPEDVIGINGTGDASEGSRVIVHLDRIRKLACIADRAHVETRNNFPAGTGLSSSASGFAALTLAATAAAGLALPEKELSILARQGSGSACRSIPDGFTEWLDGDTSDTSYAVSLHPPGWWDIADVVAVASTGPKDVSSSAGQKLVGTSPFFSVRKARMAEKLARAKTLLAGKNFSGLGELAEAEALEMHAVMITSNPSLIYWTPQTITLMKAARHWRAGGLEVYFTINTGQDVHFLCRQKDAAAVEEKLTALPEVKRVVVCKPSIGGRIVTRHLF